MKKNPKVSIILAIIFSYWTWLYTFKKDYWKFFIAMILNIILWIHAGWVGTTPIWLWSLLDIMLKKDSYWDDC